VVGVRQHDGRPGGTHDRHHRSAYEHLRGNARADGFAGCTRGRGGGATGTVPRPRSDQACEHRGGCDRRQSRHDRLQLAAAGGDRRRKG
jgi:hypothetical protein